MTDTENVNRAELQKFGSHAEQWWDPEGNLKTLHQINPLRMDFIQRHARLNGARMVDIGCGGGILTEALAAAGADALGIDLSADLIDIAELHGLESGVNANYRVVSAEDLAAEQAGQYDHAVCMEMLEHVPDPAAIVQAAAALVKPGGMVFFSTLNRGTKAYLLAIVAAEYLLKMLPKGTHDFNSFIKPAELCRMARNAGLSLEGMAGVHYNPLNKQFSLGPDVGVNYLAAFRRLT